MHKMQAYMHTYRHAYIQAYIHTHRSLEGCWQLARKQMRETIRRTPLSTWRACTGMRM